MLPPGKHCLFNLFNFQTIRTYYESPPGINLSSSLYNVHEPNSINNVSMIRSDHILSSSGQHLPQHRLIQQHTNSGISSQSESNILNIRSYSPTNFKPYGRLGKSIFRLDAQQYKIV